MEWIDIQYVRFIPESGDVGLLLLRIGFGLSLFLKHGLETLTKYSRMVVHFSDPIGISSHASLAYALLTDGICSLLVILGLGTRWAALLISIFLTVALMFVHHMDFFGNGHVELVVAYTFAFLTLLISGPGRYSLDHCFNRVSDKETWVI